MKTYADLFLESPRVFLRKLEEDIKGIEARLGRLDRLALGGIGDLLTEYERLSLLVEQKAYGVPLTETWSWKPGDGSPAVPNVHLPESMGDGTWFSWTGPEPTTKFAVPLRRDCALQLRIGFMRVMEEPMLDRLKVSIDGKPIRHRIAGLEVFAEIPKRDKPSPAPTLLSLDTGTTAVPGGDGNGRRLGIALLSIAVDQTVLEESHA